MYEQTDDLAKFYTPYFNSLKKSDDGFIERKIEEIARECNGTGLGFRNLIFDTHSAVEALEEFTQLGIAVYCITWHYIWSQENARIFGEPGSEMRAETQSPQGQFSKCARIADYDVSSNNIDIFSTTQNRMQLAAACNADIKDYLQMRFPRSQTFSQALRPGLNLLMPPEWHVFP